MPSRVTDSKHGKEQRYLQCKNSRCENNKRKHEEEEEEEKREEDEDDEEEEER